MNELFKSIFFVLVLIILGISVVLIVDVIKPNEMSYNNVTLSSADYNTIKEVFGDNYSVIRVCNLEKGNCILLGNIEHLKKTKLK